MAQDVSHICPSFCHYECTVFTINPCLQLATVTVKVLLILQPVSNMEENALADPMLLVELVTCVLLVPMTYPQWAVEVGTLSM